MIRPRGHNTIAKISSVTAKVLGVVVAAVAVIGLGWVTCVGVEASDDKVLAALTGTGVRDVELGGTRRWKCGQEDSASREFTGTSATGERVRGVVCCTLTGCGKGCTVRWLP